MTEVHDPTHHSEGHHQTHHHRLNAPYQQFKFVILGCGNSAGYAALEFVRRGLVPGELAIVGEEPELPYERPALSKAVLVNPKVRLPGFHTCVGAGGDRQNREFYDHHGIALFLAETVVRADLLQKTLHTRSGKTIVADRALILATGASPIRLDRLPGSNLHGIHYLRNYQDALSLYGALHVPLHQDAQGVQDTKDANDAHDAQNAQNAQDAYAPSQDTSILPTASSSGSEPIPHSKSTAVVIGGGYIGMEVAAAASTVGWAVNMVFPGNHLMHRLFTSEIAHHYEQVYVQNNVQFYNTGAVCEEFVNDGNGNVCGVRVTRGEEQDILVEGSVVIVGIGARPNTHLFAGQIEMDERGGVLVDSKMKTSIDCVFACGDIATFPLKLHDGKPTRAEHVTQARLSAVHAVKSIYGGTDDYDYLPYFYSRIFSLAWQFFGDHPPSAECVVVGNFDPKLIAFWIEDERMVGIFHESPSQTETETMRSLARLRPSIDRTKLKLAKTTTDALDVVKQAASLHEQPFFN